MNQTGFGFDVGSGFGFGGQGGLNFDGPMFDDAAMRAQAERERKAREQAREEETRRRNEERRREQEEARERFRQWSEDRHRKQGYQSPHDVLGVNFGATKSEIRAAWARLCKQFHPDTPTGDAERIKAINNAYNRLKKGRS